MRSEMAGRRSIKGFTHRCYFQITVVSASTAPLPSQLNEARRERVTHEDSWKEQSMFASVMLWWGITGTSSVQPKPTKSPIETADGGGGERTTTQGHHRERSIHTLSQFTVLGGWLCFLCLSGSFCLSLSFSPLASHCARGKAEKKSADVCTNTMTPRSVVFLNQQGKTKLKNNGGNRKRMSCFGEL